MAEVDPLEKKVQDLAVGVVGLSGAMREVGRALREDVDNLREEIDTQRALGKYNRRTHFQVMYWVALFAVHVGDAVNYWAFTYPALGDFVFWARPHPGGGLGWRVAGAATQLALLALFWHRAQVPDYLFGRVASGASNRPSLYNKILGRVS